MNIEIPNREVVLAEGDYIKDGLIYCGKCHEAKQRRLRNKSINIDRIVSCQCKCEAAAYEAEKEACIEQTHRQWIENLRSSGIQDRRMLKYSFGQDRARTVRSASCAVSMSRIGKRTMITFSDSSFGETWEQERHSMQAVLQMRL